MPNETPSRSRRARASNRVELDPRLITYIEKPQGIGIEIWEQRRLKNRIRRLWRRLAPAKP